MITAALQQAMSRRTPMIATAMIHHLQGETENCTRSTLSGKRMTTVYTCAAASTNFDRETSIRRYVRAIKWSSGTKRKRKDRRVTIVTVIFLPLSFLAAFFGIVLKGLPYNDDDRLPLSFILKYAVGVGVSTALAFVLMAWHHHSAVRWSQGKVSKAKPMKNAVRGTWL